MYTINNNNQRVPIAPPVIARPEMFTFSNNDTPEGSNKMILYIALFFGITVTIVSGYYLYTGRKNKKAFGYQL